MKKKRLAFIVLALLLVAIAVWWLWIFVPLPSYVPSGGEWRRIAKHTTHLWGRPCVYARFAVNRPQSSVATEVKRIISGLREWESFSERTSEDIFAQLGKRGYQDIADQQRLAIQAVAPPFGGEFALETDRPFLALHWFAHEKPATHHSITVRLIDVGRGECLVELWDFRTFDH
jgi:hypothetical protein